MVRHRVTIYHDYQDLHNPAKKFTRLQCDYATTYAFFKALIDSGKQFDIELETRKKGQKEKVE